MIVSIRRRRRYRRQIDTELPQAAADVTEVRARL
jgi:hypothetical protein